MSNTLLNCMIQCYNIHYSLHNIKRLAKYKVQQRKTIVTMSLIIFMCHRQDMLVVDSKSYRKPHSSSVESARFSCSPAIKGQHNWIVVASDTMVDINGKTISTCIFGWWHSSLLHKANRVICFINHFCSHKRQLKRQPDSSASPTRVHPSNFI